MKSISDPREGSWRPAGRAIRFLACAMALGAIIAPVPGFAAKTAMCRVESGNNVAFVGKCTFVPDSGGSFYLRALDAQKPLYGTIMSVSVFIVKPGQAEVSGSVRGGNTSRWGPAVRSHEQPECWAGEDFRVCAR